MDKTDSVKVQHDKFNKSIDHFTGCLCFKKEDVWKKSLYYYSGIIRVMIVRLSEAKARKPF